MSLRFFFFFHWRRPECFFLFGRGGGGGYIVPFSRFSVVMFDRWYFLVCYIYIFIVTSYCCLVFASYVSFLVFHYLILYIKFFLQFYYFFTQTLNVSDLNAVQQIICRVALPLFPVEFFFSYPPLCCRFYNTIYMSEKCQWRLQKWFFLLTYPLALTS